MRTQSSRRFSMDVVWPVGSKATQQLYSCVDSTVVYTWKSERREQTHAKMVSRRMFVT